MISVKTGFVLGVVLVELLLALTACAQQAQIQTPIQTDTQTNQATEVKPTSTTKDSQELVPLSAPAATEPKESAPAPQTPASAVRPSNNADDPRAVIDWLLDKSRRGR